MPSDATYSAKACELLVTYTQTIEAVAESADALACCNPENCNTSPSILPYGTKTATAIAVVHKPLLSPVAD